jgi:hypothetical protein
MNVPGIRFHALVGRESGRYAVNASGNWRITFGWSEGDAINVDLEDIIKEGFDAQEASEARLASRASG